MTIKILLLTCLLPFCLSGSLRAQQEGPRFFHYHEIEGNRGNLRKAALEYIAISGDHTEAGDRRLIDTLKMFLGQLTPPNSKGLWPHFSGVVKNLQIRRAGWRELPEELKGFRHLFEISFIECPNISLQSINDQIKARRDANRDDDFYRKFKNDIVSLSFVDTDFKTLDSCILEKELLEELKELRFVRIGNFKQQCHNLLTELNKAYPELGWLTIEACGLDNMQNLMPLYRFEKLRSLSLSRNHLTRLPKVPPSLKALDVSFNFIREFPAPADSNALKELDFLYLECNLFDYYELYNVLSDNLLEHMEVFTYDPCNFEDRNNLPLLSAALDKKQVAVFMPFVSRYDNDFSPVVENCDRCVPHRDDFINELLREVTFVDSSGQESQIALLSTGRIKMESMASTQQSRQVYIYKQLKSCIRDFPDPAAAAQIWDWQLCFRLENTDGSQLKNMFLYIKDQKGMVDWGE